MSLLDVFEMSLNFKHSCLYEPFLLYDQDLCHLHGLVRVSMIIVLNLKVNCLPYLY